MHNGLFVWLVADGWCGWGYLISDRALAGLPATAFGPYMVPPRQLPAVTSFSLFRKFSFRAPFCAHFL
jgi:hypothetical protein